MTRIEKVSCGISIFLAAFGGIHFGMATNKDMVMSQKIKGYYDRCLIYALSHNINTRDACGNMLDSWCASMGMQPMFITLPESLTEGSGVSLPNDRCFKISIAEERYVMDSVPE
jgi:hypothetical protein